MNDLAKGVEGGSRAFELYEGAMNSAGTATEKYGIYQESIKASQAGLTLELEKLYGLLGSDVFKDFYSNMSGFINMISSGTVALDGMNLVVPLVGAVILGLGVAMNAAAVGATFAAFSFAALWAALSAHPIMLAIGAFAVLAVTVSGLGSIIGKEALSITEGLSNVQTKIDEIATSQGKWNTKIGGIEALRSEYMTLTSKVSLTADEEERLRIVMEEIAELSPTLAAAIESQNGVYGGQTGVLKALNAELEKSIRLKNSETRMKARDMYGDLATTGQALIKKSEEVKS